MGIPDHLTGFLRNLYTGQAAPAKTRHGTTDGSILGKEYDKSIYCCLDYLTCMQSTSHEMPGWMNHKLESRFPGEIATTSGMVMIPF